MQRGDIDLALRRVLPTPRELARATAAAGAFDLDILIEEAVACGVRPESPV